ncbi:MAG: ParA family protein [Spirochaetaceae bacterium]
MKTLTLYNLKGGVGKTAAAVNLAYLAAEAGYRTLLCDLDPQGATSFYLRVRPPKGLNVRTLLRGGKRLRDSVRESDYRNLDLLPAALSYRRLDRELAKESHTKKRISLSFAGFGKRYDLLVIDAPPSIGLEGENLIRAADLALVPVIPSVLSINAFEQILRVAEKQKLSRERFHPFVSMADVRKKLHRDLIPRVVALAGGRITAVVPYASVVEKMGVTREPVVVSNPKAKASLAFRQLWEETAVLLSLPKNRNTPSDS